MKEMFVVVTALGRDSDSCRSTQQNTSGPAMSVPITVDTQLILVLGADTVELRENSFLSCRQICPGLSTSQRCPGF